MNQETEIAVVAATSDKKSKMDAQSKLLFSYKEILAPILKMLVPEYEDLSIGEIIKCIESTDNNKAVDAVSQIAAQDEHNSVADKLIRFDQYFKAKNPKLSNTENTIHIHFDFELQKSFNPSNPHYPLMKRVQYYVARELCDQLGVITEETNYDKLEKCYSIWICSDDIPQKRRNSVAVYHTEEDIIGGDDFREEPENYDLMTSIVVCRGLRVLGSKKDIFDYLEAVFKGNIQRLNEYTNTEESPELVKEVEHMRVMQDASYTEGMVVGLIKYLRDQGKTDEAIMKEIINRYHLSEEDAFTYLMISKNEVYA